MKVLIVGCSSGAHALAWKLIQSDQVEKVYVAPGSPGTADEPKVENLEVETTDIPGLANAAAQYDVDYTLITPTQALAAGIVDYFQERGLKVLAPTREASKLEWSKEYSKQFMQRHKIPTPGFKVFADAPSARQYAHTRSLPLVLKVDGMANGGLGVVIAHEWQAVDETIEHMFTTYGGPIIVEDFLVGEEVSFTVLFDGSHYVPMVESRDYKRLHDNDKGPNTGDGGVLTGHFPGAVPEDHRPSCRADDQGHQGGCNRLPGLPVLRRDDRPGAGSPFAGNQLPPRQSGIVHDARTHGQ